MTRKRELRQAIAEITDHLERIEVALEDHGIRTSALPFWESRPPKGTSADAMDETVEDVAPLQPSADALRGFGVQIQTPRGFAGSGPEIYRIPGQPPTERRVRMHLPDADEVGQRTYGRRVWTRARDGRWFDNEGREWSWSEMLEYSDLELMPLTPEEEAEAELYGPPGERWGAIGEPCSYEACLLWSGHVGPHRDDKGDLGVTTEDPMASRITASATDEDRNQPCNCGRPAQHRPTCNRYRRTTGGQP